jgi:hypothetical protein
MPRKYNKSKRKPKSVSKKRSKRRSKLCRGGSYAPFQPRDAHDIDFIQLEELEQTPPQERVKKYYGHQQSTCYICNDPFNLGFRLTRSGRHHCRNCFISVCNKHFNSTNRFCSVCSSVPRPTNSQQWKNSYLQQLSPKEVDIVLPKLPLDVQDLIMNKSTQMGGSSPNTIECDIITTDDSIRIPFKPEDNIYQTLETAISERYIRNGIPIYTIKTISSGDNQIFDIYNSLSNIYNDEIKCDEYGSEENARTFEDWGLEDEARIIIELSHTAKYALNEIKGLDNKKREKAEAQISHFLPSVIDGNVVLEPPAFEDGFFDIPDCFGDLIILGTLNLEKNEIVKLPESFYNIHLLELILDYNQISEPLPAEFCKIRHNSVRLSKITNMDMPYDNISVQYNPINTYPLAERLQNPDDDCLVYWGD